MKIWRAWRERRHRKKVHKHRSKSWGSSWLDDLSDIFD